MNNSRIWDALGKTDPAHTKQFSRAGGFKGTAIKPQWAIKNLTNHFGPAGTGWGMGEPSFQIVSGDNREVLVFCTVAGWYTEASEKRTVYGVGGDKIVTHIKANEKFNRPERWENDDEAFKKAYTDAVMNAFKFIGVGADVHMGQFDDSKYVAEVAEEFAATAEPSITDQQASEISAALKATGKGEKAWLAHYGYDRLTAIPREHYEGALKAANKAKPKAKPQTDESLNDEIPHMEQPA